MKRFLYLSLLLISVFFSNRVAATHIYGGELLYTHVAGNTYKVTLTFYGDCAATIVNTLYTNTPLIHIANGNINYTDIDLQPEVGTGKEVSPVCPSQLNQTACSSIGGMLPGVRKFTFSNTVTLSGASANWRFIFAGTLPPGNAAGRSSQISNVNGAGNTIIYLEATLNNTKGANSSPQYSTIPTPFYCIHIAESYNQGALDPDNDSLVFSLTPALDSIAPNTAGSVVYNPTFTATSPLSVTPGSYSFNVLNGQMNFTPDVLQDALIVTKVSEYRNGVLVGTSMRELTFIVLDNCTAPPPAASIDTKTINGAEVDSNNVFYVCEGSSGVSFNIKTTSPTNDTITVTVNNALPNATTTVFNNNTLSPLINFAWNTTAIKAGVYNFFVSLKNNHCPISSTQTFAYTIYVVKPNTDTAKQLTATQCVHRARVEYDFKYGLLPRTVKVFQHGNLIDSLRDTTGVVLDSLSAGKYVIEVSSPYLNCPTFYNFTVVDSGALPSPRAYNFYECINGPEDTIKFVPFGGASVVWHNIDGTVIPGAPRPSTSSLGDQQWYVIQTYNVCVSYSDTVTVIIRDLPNISVLNGNEPVCLGDKIYLRASGGLDYKWASQTNKLFTDTGGVYTIVFFPDTYNVTGHDKYNCFNSSSFSIDSIINCCLFSYPNTFTPNGDLLNDKFHVVIYGNVSALELEIFNRWGERVFHTFNPNEGWDGNYKGRPCEIGTYFYFFRSRCLTGHDEKHKGEITLLR